MDRELLNTLVLLIALGAAAQWSAWRLRLPAIVLLSVAGLIVGPVLGLVRPAQDLGGLLRPLIQLGVAIILFEGGLNLRLHELRTAASAVRRLVIPGVPLAWLLGAAAAHVVGGLSWPVALLFGAIIVVTGPTVIIPLLRQARLRQRPASLLKWEGIVNDPIGALLAVVVFEFLSITAQGGRTGEVLTHFVYSVISAGLIGYVGAMGLIMAFQRAQVPEFLKAPVMLAVMVSFFGIANLLQDEAGLVTATVFGVVIGNSRLPSIDEIRRFKEYISILLVSTVFILLTADLDPEILRALDWSSAGLIAVILLLVRPLTVFAATIGADIEFEERVLLAWIAPRGIVAAAVAGAFAPGLNELGHAGAEQLLPLVFVLILTTVVLHGFSIGWLARRLGLASQGIGGLLIVGASPWSTDLARVLKDIGIQARVADASWHRLRAARLGGIPFYYGQVISESAEHSLALHDIAYLLAATDNDAYNALVCTRYANEIGRNRVFQLPMLDSDEDDPKAFVPSLRGNVVFGEEAVYEEMLRRYFQGWRFQKTKLSETFSLEALERELPEEFLYVLVITADGRLNFAGPKTKLEPAAGDTLIIFMPEPPRAKPASGGAN